MRYAKENNTNLQSKTKGKEGPAFDPNENDPLKRWYSIRAYFPNKAPAVPSAFYITLCLHYVADGAQFFSIPLLVRPQGAHGGLQIRKNPQNSNF